MISAQTVDSVSARVLNIVHDGPPGNRAPCVILAEGDSDRVEPFEVWLAYSSAAIGGARSLIVGDSFTCEGAWEEPVRSHRTHGGLHKAFDYISFFRATYCRKEQSATP